MSNVCSITGCTRKHKGRGFCEYHLRRFKKYGDPLYTPEEKVCSVCGGAFYRLGLCHECFKQSRHVGQKARKNEEQCKVPGCENVSRTAGYCQRCYTALSRHGSLERRAINDLEGEEWRDIERAGCTGYMVSNLGRIKSCRGRHERLMKTKMIQRSEGCVASKFASGKHSFYIHMEVLRAFHPNTDGDSTPVFLDGNRDNCRADNLAWYGRSYLIEKAIEAAEASDHPLADCFLRFYHGEHNALNTWFESLHDRISRFLRHRLDGFNVPYYIDVENAVQETFVQAFLGLYRGMVSNLYAVESWVYSVAKRVLGRSVRDVFPAVSMFNDDRTEGNEYNVIDQAGWRHPAAELVAMCREEGVYA